MSEKRSFLAELKRRHVDKVALTYAVVSWLLIEVASILLPSFDAPTWVMKALIVFVVLGFIFALIVSWSFEMTPEGMKRTSELSPDEVLPYWSRRKFATFIIGVAVLAFALFGYQLLRPKPPAMLAHSETASIRQTPIGVSPFESPGGSTSPGETRSTDERTIRDLETQWSKAAAEKDLEKMLSFYADDATVLPANAPAATTKDNARRLWTDLFASAGLALSWRTIKVEVAKSGEMAYATGTYELTTNDASGNPTTDHGKYLTVWEKQSDGKWKCAADIWNSDIAASTAAPLQKK
jgi:uncharacterized protein (TIGR02246 family)